MSVLKELLARIDDGRPGGTDVSYETEYSSLASLREEAREGDGDFDEVVELATKILTEDSKDLTVAVWYTEARLHLDGYGGLGDGLCLLHGLLDGLWEHVFPEEPEDRAYVLDFVGDGFKARDERYDPLRFVSLTTWGHHHHHFEEWSGIRKDSFGDEGKGKKKSDGDDDSDPRAPRNDNFDQGFAETGKAWYRERKSEVVDCLEAVQSLQALSQERFGGGKGHCPSFVPLRESLERASKYLDALIAKKLQIDPDPPGAEVGGSGGTTGAGGDALPEDGSAGTQKASAAARAATPEPSDAADAEGRIVAAARFLRRANPADPVPYLVLRAMRWGELRAVGGALDPRLLDSPPTAVRKQLKTHLLNAEWEPLLAAAEEVMATPAGRGWLDLQRYVLTALENLGSAYRAVTEAVRGELTRLLHDLPELVTKTLMDDTPTANGETVQWLDLTGIVVVEGTSGKEDAAPDYDRERIMSEATHEKALEWVAIGQPQRGVELLMKRADREESDRARFITESLAASVLVNAGMTAVARPILEQLVDQVSKRNLEQWESAAVVAKPLGLLYHCLPDNDRRRAQLYDDICRLDPVQAITLDRGASTPTGKSPPAKAEPADEPAEAPGEGPAVDS